MPKRDQLIIWNIPNDKLHQWKRLQPQVDKQIATDCTINSLHLLGVLENREFSEVLAKEANIKKGTYPREIIDILYHYFNNSPDTKIKINTSIKQSTRIRDELPNNAFTLALFTQKNGSGHAVIITKQNDILYVLDPQQETHFCELDTLNDWYQSQEYIYGEYLYYNKIARLRDSTPTPSHTPSKSKSKNKNKSNTHTIKNISSPNPFSTDIKFEIGTTPIANKHNKKRTHGKKYKVHRKTPTRLKSKSPTIDSLTNKLKTLQIE